MAPAASPTRSVYKLQAALLSEVRTFSPASLSHVPIIRVTDASGAVREEPWRELQVSGGRTAALVAHCAVRSAASVRVRPADVWFVHPLMMLSSMQRASEAEAAAMRVLAAARAHTKRDCLPCRVSGGLFIGGAGAARNLKALRKRGITAVVNAAPSVPCYFKDCPEDEFTYLSLPLFDDPDAGGCLTWLGTVAKRDVRDVTATCSARGAYAAGCRLSTEVAAL